LLPNAPLEIRLRAFHRWLLCNIEQKIIARSPMSSTIVPKINLLRLLTVGPIIRFFVALAILATIGTLLRTLPEPLIQKVVKIPPPVNFERSNPAPPNDSEVQIVELRQRATDALASLKAKSVTANSANLFHSRR
jgi:hypothetical protein